MLLLFFVGFRKEIIETNPQWLLCNFNQEKYQAELDKYTECLKKNKGVKNQFGYFVCSNEPQKESFYDKKIQYNLVKRTSYKFFDLSIFQTKKAFPKTCNDI